MKIVRLIISSIIILSLIFTIFIGKDKIKEENFDKSNIQYQGVLTLWQVDSFEGGVGSRKQFLLKVAREFEKQNNGTLIMVINQTPEGVKESIKKGVYPDIISFGVGTYINGFSKLNTNNYTLGGLIGEDVYATSWCRGNYTLISKEKLDDLALKNIDELIVSKGKFNQPLTAFSLENLSATNIKVFAPLDAYTNYLSSKNGVLLGTQRDIFRLKNRGENFYAYPLSNYNDLYQYISILSTEEVKRFYAEKFINYLVSDSVQNKLNQIGMLSCYTKANYSEEVFINMQSLNKFKTISAFTLEENLLKMHDNCYSYLKGDLQALKKVEKMLI